MLETLLALLLLKSALAADAKCPEGWDVKSDPNSGCYILVNRPMPHKLAQKYCSALDKRAKLVRVEDALENSFLKGSQSTPLNHTVPASRIHLQRRYLAASES